VMGRDTDSESLTGCPRGQNRSRWHNSEKLPSDESQTPQLPDDPLAGGNGIPGEPHLPQEPPAKRARREEVIEFNVSKNRGVHLKRLLCNGLERDKTKEMGGRFLPVFHRSFVSEKLVVPTLDDAVYQRLMVVKKSKAGKSSIDLHEKDLFKVQQKVLDAIKPILFLSNEKLENDVHHEAVKTALSLMGEAFFSLTDARRHTILRQTSPSFTFMLGNTSNFNDDEAEDLLSPSLRKW